MKKGNREIEVSYGVNNTGEPVFSLSIGDYTLSNISPVEAKQLHESFGEFVGESSDTPHKKSVFDMDIEERSQFEQIHNTCIVDDAFGNNTIMVELSSDSEGNEYLTLLDDNDDVPLAYLVKGDVRKLRDYLNNYLENNFKKQ